jgi:ABC-type phosphate transport system substrate-binding protein
MHILLDSAISVCSGAIKTVMRKSSLSGVRGAIRISGLIVGAALFFLPLQSSAGDSQDSIVVIANKSVGPAKISRDDLRPIFQTKKDTWPDGSSAKPFNLPDSNKVRQGFDAAVLGLDPDRVARYWIDRKIRGGERPPQTAPSSAVMVKVISKTPGGVGYVEAAAVDASVKVIAKIVDGQVVTP